MLTGPLLYKWQDESVSVWLFLCLYMAAPQAALPVWGKPDWLGLGIDWTDICFLPLSPSWKKTQHKRQSIRLSAPLSQNSCLPQDRTWSTASFWGDYSNSAFILTVNGSWFETRADSAFKYRHQNESWSNILQFGTHNDMIMSSIDKGLKCFYDRTVQRLLDNVHASHTVNPVFFFLCSECVHFKKHSLSTADPWQGLSFLLRMLIGYQSSWLLIIGAARYREKQIIYLYWYVIMPETQNVSSMPAYSYPRASDCDQVGTFCIHNLWQCRRILHLVAHVQPVNLPVVGFCFF